MGRWLPQRGWRGQDGGMRDLNDLTRPTVPSGAIQERMLAETEERRGVVGPAPALPDDAGAPTALRAALNRPRPTVVLGLPPLLNKEKKGESFPSRHVLSAAVITAVFFYTAPPLGPVLAAITLLIALVRVIGGVHFVKDVAAGALLGGALGWLGCFVL